MIDLVTLKVKGGRGGDGAIAFAVQKYKPKAPPSGGSGGKGGSVYLVTDINVATLKDFASKKDFEAENGYRGGSNDKTGRCGNDLYIRVPVGITVSHKNKVLGTLETIGQTLLVATGGVGGRGNAHMPSDKPREAEGRNNRQLSVHLDEATVEERNLIEFGGRKFSKEKHIYYAEKGQKGENKELVLELKLIADVGLIGLPNAGKSSLLNALTRTTNARVGSYPFTTLEPNLGVIADVAARHASPTILCITNQTNAIGDACVAATSTKNQNTGQQIVLADIPGLIEGASSGKGLGANFLKHIEKTKVLVHIISAENLIPVILASVARPESEVNTDSGVAPMGLPRMTELPAYKTIREELGKWNPALLDKPEIVVVNKIDLINTTTPGVLKFFTPGVNTLFVSALTGEGVEELKKAIVTTVILPSAVAEPVTTSPKAGSPESEVKMNSSLRRNDNADSGVATLPRMTEQTSKTSQPTFSIKNLPNKKMVFGKNQNDTN